MAYKYFYQKRKEKKAFVENLKPRAVFDMSILPEESKENLQKSLEDVIRKETLANTRNILLLKNLIRIIRKNRKVKRNSLKMQFIIARLQSVRLKVIWNYWKKH